MGLRDLVRKYLHWFDQQVENYPAEDKRPAQPVHRAPAVRRTPPPAPPAAPSRARHRLDEPRRSRPDSGTDIDPAFGMPLASAAPYWMDTPGHHDHRHHGQAVNHEPTDTGSTNTGHHHGGGHHDGGGGHHSGGFDGGHHHGGGHDGGGGFDGGNAASCGSGF